MRFKIVGFVVAALMLGGCAAPSSNLSFSVPNVGFSSKKIPAELRSMTVTVARNDERKGELVQGIGEANVPQLWQTALQESLNKMAIFQDDAPRKVNLSVKILALAAPSSGLAFTTTSIARYELIDRANGAIIYTGEITAQGTTPVDYAFLGKVRARESVNRSVQVNISQFLQALQDVDVTKPMFPVAP